MSTARNRMILGQSIQSGMTRNSEVSTYVSRSNGGLNRSERFKKNATSDIVEGNKTVAQWLSKGRFNKYGRSSLSPEDS
jgi:hypothetical protein